MFFENLGAARFAARARGSSRDPDLPHPSGRRPDASRATPESGRVRAPRLEEALAFCSPSLPVPRLSAIPQPAKLRDSKGPPGSRQRLATTAPFRSPS